MKLTDKVNVEFDLNWRGNFNLGIGVFADKFDAYSGNSYMVRFSPNDCYLMHGQQRTKQSGPSQFSGSSRQGQGAHFRAHQQEEGTIALVLNNRVVKEWEDNAGLLARVGM